MTRRIKCWLICSCILPLQLLACPSLAQNLREGADTTEDALMSEGPLAQPPLNGVPVLENIKIDPTEAEISASIYVQNITVKNATAIPPASMDEVLRRYEGKQLGKSELQALANDLTGLYQDDGYFLSKALIRPQEFENSELKVTMSEGYFSSISIDSQTDHPLLGFFSEVLNERPANYETFANAIRRFRAATGITLKVGNVTKSSNDADGYAIELEATGNRLKTRLDVLNKGVREGEAWRALITGQAGSVLKKGDNVTLGYLTKPALTSELQYFIGRYEVPIGHDGLVLSLEGTASDSQPKSALGSRDLDGNLRSGSIGLRKPMALSARRQFITSAKFEWSDSEESEDGSLLYKDKLRVLRLAGSYKEKFKKRLLARGFIEVSQGLDALGASDEPGVLTSRLDADGKFLKLKGEAALQKFFSDKVSITAAMKAQYSDSPLLYLEEFSIGGGAFGRGYDFGEVLGDSGIAGYIEASLHGTDFQIFDRWEIYAYLDAGAVWNRGINLSSDGRTLYSAGAGTRLNLNDHIFVGYEAAKPLSDAPFTLDDEDVRHRVQITLARQ